MGLLLRLCFYERVEINKNNVSLYIDAIWNLEKAAFLLGHVDSKIKFGEEETVKFDLEVCESLIIQTLNSPLMVLSTITFSEEESQLEGGGNFSLMIERLNGAITEIKNDLNSYLSKNLSA